MIKEVCIMAKKKSKKMSALALVLVLVIIVGTALAFTGLFLDWTTRKTDLAVTSVEYNKTLQDWADENDLAGKLNGEIKYFTAVNMFAWITAAAVAVAAVLFIVKMVIRLRLLSMLGGIAGAVGLVCAVLTIIFTVLMVQETEFMSSKVTPAVGCYLVLAGGVLGGGAAIAGAVKS